MFAKFSQPNAHCWIKGAPICWNSQSFPELVACIDAVPCLDYIRLVGCWYEAGWHHCIVGLSHGKVFLNSFQSEAAARRSSCTMVQPKLTAFLHQGHHYHYICHHHLKGFAEYETIQMQPNSKKLGNLFELFRHQNALKRFDNQIDPRFLQFCGPIVGWILFW